MDVQLAPHPLGAGAVRSRPTARILIERVERAFAPWDGARKWRLNSLKRLDPRPEMSIGRKARTPKDPAPRRAPPGV